MALTCELDEHRLGHLILDRADALNSLTVEIASTLGDAAHRLHARGARALVVYGRGPTFCAGADLTLVREALSGDAHTTLTPLVRGLHTSLKAMRELPVPVIAAIEGPAVGAGLGVALAADLRVAAQGARLVPGYFGIGSSPDGGVSFHLARTLGPARARRVIMLNETIDAASGHSLGLIDQVVPDGHALDAALELALHVANTPGQALVRTRALLESAFSTPLSQHLDREERLVTELWDTHDFREGVSAFLEHRPAQFRGD